MISDSIVPPVLGLAAYSGSGKTTLLTQVIRLLAAMNLRIAVIKHSHHDFSIDQPGKDSYELHHAGAAQTLLTSRYRSALITENRSQHEPKLDDALRRLNLAQLDLVVVEGFRHTANLKKIECHRPALGKPLLFPDDDQIIAIATDDAALSTHLPVLDINAPEQVTEFIVKALHLPR